MDYGLTSDIQCVLLCNIIAINGRIWCSARKFGTIIFRCYWIAFIDFKYLWHLNSTIFSGFYINSTTTDQFSILEPGNFCWRIWVAWLAVQLNSVSTCTMGNFWTSFCTAQHAQIQPCIYRLKVNLNNYLWIFASNALFKTNYREISFLRDGRKMFAIWGLATVLHIIVSSWDHQKQLGNAVWFLNKRIGLTLNVLPLLEPFEHWKWASMSGYTT